MKPQSIMLKVEFEFRVQVFGVLVSGLGVSSLDCWSVAYMAESLWSGV